MQSLTKVTPHNLNKVPITSARTSMALPSWKHIRDAVDLTKRGHDRTEWSTTAGVTEAEKVEAHVAESMEVRSIMKDRPL